MSDNLCPHLLDSTLLDDRAVLAISGPDAVVFSHAQFTADVAGMADGQWRWSAWLTPKGRTITVFQLLRLSSEALLLVFADGDADEIRSQLQRFVFRRKVTITLRGDLQVTGALAAPLVARAGRLAGSVDAGLELDVGSAALPRTLGIVPRPVAEVDPAFVAAWRTTDLRFGLPRLAPSQREQWTPQQLGLDRLDAYSVRKGCYPGQEIVARTHFLGKAKRAVQLLQLAEPCEPGAAVSDGGNTIGTVISTAGTVALAVLPLDNSEASLQVDGQVADRLPLWDGLAR